MTGGSRAPATVTTDRPLTRVEEMAALEALVDDFEPGQEVTVRDRTEIWRVMDKHDPRGGDTGLNQLCCVPLILCRPLSPYALTSVSMWIEPRDLHNAHDEQETA